MKKITILFALLCATVLGYANIYVKVNAVADLQDGDVIILANEEASKVAGSFNKKMFSAEDATFTNGTVSSSAAEEITLQADGNNFILLVGQKPLYPTSDKAALATGDQGKAWEITIADGEATVKYTEKVNGKETSIQYNKPSPRFTNYASQQTGIQIYKLDPTHVDPSDGENQDDENKGGDDEGDDENKGGDDEGEGEDDQPVSGDYSTVETSNIALPVEGESVSVAEVNGEVAIKAGTTKKAGVWEFTVPAGTEQLHLHAAAWKGKACKLTVEGKGVAETLSLIADDGVQQNSPFTLVGDPEDYYFVLDFTKAAAAPRKANGLAAATKLTFTATENNRFVVWGVNVVGDDVKPDDLGGNNDEGGEDEYDYSAEPTKKGNFTETFDYADFSDYTEAEEDEYPVVDLYFESEDGGLELYFITDKIVDKTIIPVGTYPIDNSGKENTFIASAGSMEYRGTSYPMPSYYSNNFKYDEEGQVTDYDVYFLVSGTVTVAAAADGAKITIDAVSYNGSTVKATYEGEIVESEEDEEGGNGDDENGDALEEVNVTLDINAPMYNTLGVQVDKNYNGIVIQNGNKFLRQ